MHCLVDVHQKATTAEGTAYWPRFSLFFSSPHLSDRTRMRLTFCLGIGSTSESRIRGKGGRIVVCRSKAQSIHRESWFRIVNANANMVHNEPHCFGRGTAKRIVDKTSSTHFSWEGPRLLLVASIFLVNGGDDDVNHRCLSAHATIVEDKRLRSTTTDNKRQSIAEEQKRIEPKLSALCLVPILLPPSSSRKQT